ncbi:hypothetical protein GCM10023085_45330 [Actinomadura viridis]|uniref:Uncharacterized protein n=1 Tax=Actinomadura viridis TaxID=58110 RepID=A0A931DJT8_9ACTN|nr:hypothetical protein [Actinomadura viridis]MBG6089893.1 hypothetical protein [Actinomadura viridis]
MAKAGYTVTTGGAVALTGGAAKTVLGVRANAAFGLDLKKVRVSFDGTTATAVPALVEVCYCTWATNGTMGTNNTTLTSAVAQLYGRAQTHGVTAGKNWTSEPTVLTPLEEWLVSPAGGIVVYDWPLGDTPDCAFSEGFAIRVTAPAGVNVRAGLVWERA